jgi:HAD superfamily hydrolase (TIGR01549 family)
MNAAFDTVVIDVDGTLLDSNYHHTIAWARAFEHVGETVSLWRIHRHIGMGGDLLIEAVAGKDFAREQGEGVQDRWEKEFDQLIEETRLLPGAKQLLEQLQERGVKVALASSAIPKHAEYAIELLDAERLADAATTADDAEEAKPDPELIEAALDRVKGSKACMIGDSVWDVEAASRRDLPTIGLLTGGYGRQELLDAGARAVYEDLDELLAHLDDALG